MKTLALLLVLASPLTAQVEDSHVLVSLMHSRATGRDPSFELAALEMLFGYRDFFTLGQIDIAVTTVDSLGNRELSDAGFQIARGFPAMAPGGERIPYLAAWLKVYDAEPMAGVSLGGMELAGSHGQGSRISLGMMTRLRPSAVLARGNLYVEFLFRCSGCGGDTELGSLLRVLNFRGSVVVPFDHNRPMGGKIALMLPIGWFDLRKEAG